MPAVDDDRGRAVGVHAGQQAGHDVQRPLCGREPDALQTPARLGDQGVQPLETERQMAPSLVPRQRVHLIHNEGAHPAEHGARGRRRQQQVKRLGVVTSMSGAFLRMAARSAAGVSPVRTATRSPGSP